MQDNSQEHFKAIEAGCDLTEIWYTLCIYLNNNNEYNIKIDKFEMKIGEMEWSDEGMYPIIGHKDGNNVWFSRHVENSVAIITDIQNQIHDMYIHGFEYKLKFDKTLQNIHTKLMKTSDEYCEIYGYIHTKFFDGKI